MALWRKDIFESLIVNGENHWEFEINGTIRSRKYVNRFLSVKRFDEGKKEQYHFGIDYVCTAINKGRWSKDAKDYIESEGLNLDLSKRPHEKWWHKTGLFWRIEQIKKQIFK
jgi:hypothetical protein